MAIREIVTLPDPVLRRKARKVTDFGPALQTLIDDMVATMRAAPGVGLAAPQVAVSLRVIVVEYGDPSEDGAAPKLYTLVNPEIARESRETEPGTEGCLSIPGIVGEVERASSVTVKAQDRRGRPVKVKAEGWLARIFQHEIDHLNGVLFVDRTDRVWQIDTEPVQVSQADRV